MKFSKTKITRQIEKIEEAGAEQLQREHEPMSLMDMANRLAHHLNFVRKERDASQAGRRPDWTESDKCLCPRLAHPDFPGFQKLDYEMLLAWEHFFAEHKAKGEAEHPEGQCHADHLAFVGFLNP
jgi:hypothetical protein